jgi:hypothetical protein
MAFVIHRVRCRQPPNSGDVAVWSGGSSTRPVLRVSSVETGSALLVASWVRVAALTRLAGRIFGVTTRRAPSWSSLAGLAAAMRCASRRSVHRLPVRSRRRSIAVNSFSISSEFGAPRVRRREELPRLRARPAARDLACCAAACRYCSTSSRSPPVAYETRHRRPRTRSGIVSSAMHRVKLGRIPGRRALRRSVGHENRGAPLTPRNSSPNLPRDVLEPPDSWLGN